MYDFVFIVSIFDLIENPNDLVVSRFFRTLVCKLWHE